MCGVIQVLMSPVGCPAPAMFALLDDRRISEEWLHPGLDCRFRGSDVIPMSFWVPNLRDLPPY
jgi:hypothetical protein